MHSLAAITSWYRRLSPPILLLLTALMIWGALTPDWIDPPRVGAQGHLTIRPREGAVVVRRVAPAEPSPGSTHFLYSRPSTVVPMGPIIWGRGTLSTAGWQAQTWELHLGYEHLWWLSLAGSIWALAHRLRIRLPAEGERNNQDILQQIHWRRAWLTRPILVISGSLLALWFIVWTHGVQASLGKWSISSKGQVIEMEHRTVIPFAPLDRMPGRLGLHLAVLPPGRIISCGFGGSEALPGQPHIGHLSIDIAVQRLVLFAVIPALLAIAATRRHWVLERALRANLCPNCGYDLRATPSRCPECGSPGCSDQGNLDNPATQSTTLP